uniref:Uncharacterized protein n=1 Tax=Anopheles quadriannulatus TaxID=34691 RepID=A0A182XN53_ANOQN
MTDSQQHIQNGVKPDRVLQQATHHSPYAPESLDQFKSASDTSVTRLPAASFSWSAASTDDEEDGLLLNISIGSSPSGMTCGTIWRDCRCRSSSSLVISIATSSTDTSRSELEVEVANSSVGTWDIMDSGNWYALLVAGCCTNEGDWKRMCWESCCSSSWSICCCRICSSGLSMYCWIGLLLQRLLLLGCLQQLLRLWYLFDQIHELVLLHVQQQPVFWVIFLPRRAVVTGGFICVDVLCEVDGSTFRRLGCTSTRAESSDSTVSSLSDDDSTSRSYSASRSSRKDRSRVIFSSRFWSLYMVRKSVTNVTDSSSSLSSSPPLLTSTAEADSVISVGSGLPRGAADSSLSIDISGFGGCGSSLSIDMSGFRCCASSFIVRQYQPSNILAATSRARGVGNS